MTSVDLSRFQLAALPIIFFTLTMVIIIIYNGSQQTIPQPLHRRHTTLLPPNPHCYWPTTLSQRINRVAFSKFQPTFPS